MLNITSQANANGWLLLLFVCCLVASIYLGVCVRDDLKRRDLTCLTILNRNSHRILSGAALLLFAVGFRSGIYLPIRIFREAGDAIGEVQYRAIADQAAAMMGVLVMFGLWVMMWPVLKRWFGSAVWVVLISSSFLIYGIGVALTLAFAG